MDLEAFETETKARGNHAGTIADQFKADNEDAIAIDESDIEFQKYKRTLSSYSQ